MNKEIKYELALFAGAGGGILGGMLLGHTCVGACEIEEYPRKVLLARQRDGQLPRFPIWDDICTFRSDNPECAEYFDFLRSIKDELVISGGFPCQDISIGNQGSEGIDGERSGLWKEMYRVIDEIRPAAAFMENSPMLVGRGLAVVIGDLTEVGYDSRWCVLGGNESGGFCGRPRAWILACPSEVGFSWRSERVDKRHRLQKQQIHKNKPDIGNGIWGKAKRCSSFGDWKALLESESFGTCSEVASGLDRIAAVGNGQDPSVVQLAWDILTGGE